VVCALPIRNPIVLSKPWAGPAEAFLQRLPESTSVWKVPLLCRPSPSFLVIRVMLCLVLYFFFSQLESLVVPVLVLLQTCNSQSSAIASHLSENKNNPVRCSVVLLLLGTPSRRFNDRGFSRTRTCGYHCSIPLAQVKSLSIGGIKFAVPQTCWNRKTYMTRILCSHFVIIARSILRGACTPTQKRYTSWTIRTLP
jgi:hypothetical protein